jgi:hypothetical protein
MKEVARYQFFFNSFKGIALDAETSGAYFRVLLNRQLTLINPDNQFVLAVEKVTIPVCFKQFTIDNLSSLLRFTLIDGLGDLYSGSISVPDGNYSVSDMGNTLSALLADRINTVGGISNASINWTYNTVTNRFSIQFIATYAGVLNLVFTNGAITSAIGFTNYLDITARTIVANGPFVSGDYNVNMNPIPEIYIVSDSLTDSNAFQSFPIGTSGVQATATNIVAVVHLEHSSPFYVSKEYTNPMLVPVDRSIIDTIDFDLRDYNGGMLYGFDQPWFITFSITEYSTSEVIRNENLRTFINTVRPPPITQVDFLGNTSESTDTLKDTTENLETLKQKLNESLIKLKSNVQKRKSPSSGTATVYEDSVGTTGNTTNEPTPSSSDARETKQTPIDIDGSAKRQREI